MSYKHGMKMNAFLMSFDETRALEDKLNLSLKWARLWKSKSYVYRRKIAENILNCTEVLDLVLDQIGTLEHGIFGSPRILRGKEGDIVALQICGESEILDSLRAMRSIRNAISSILSEFANELGVS